MSLETPRAAVFAIAEIKSAIAAFEEGEVNAFECLADIAVAYSAYANAGDSSREAA